MKKVLCLLVFLFQVSLSHAATTYYVSSTGEDVCNDGLTPATAFRSIARANRVALQHGDSVLFEGGSAFLGTILLPATDTGTIGNPIVVSSYGTGRATISSGLDSGVHALNVDGITIDSLIFIGTNSPIGKPGLSFHSDASDGHEGLTINNVDVSGYGGNGIEIASTVATADAYRHMRVTSSLLHDNAGSGLDVSAQYAYANVDLYVGDVTAFNNTGYSGATTPAGSGIAVGGTTTVTIEDSETYGNGANNNTSGTGPAGVRVYDSTGVVVRRVSSHGNRSISKNGDGFSIDQNTADSIFQSLTSYANEGAGYFLNQSVDTRLWNNNQLLNSTSTGDATARSHAVVLYGNVRNLVVDTNVLALTSGTSPTALVSIGNADDVNTNRYVETALFTNNAFTVTGPDVVSVSAGQLSGATSLSFLGNGYTAVPFSVVWGANTYGSCAAWHTATGQENCSSLTLTSASPNSGARTDVVAPVLMGTSFQNGATCDFGAGITVNSCTYISATEIDANVTIGAGAAFGTRTITVTNPDTQSASLIGGFTVTGGTAAAPTVTSVTPSTGEQGATLSSMSVVGTGFQSNPTCDVGAGITVNSCVQNSTTSIIMGITIAGGATIGTRTMRVTNSDTQFGTLAAAFAVVAPATPAPTVTSVTPSTGGQGTTNPTVAIVGTGFLASPTVSFGSGITVNSAVRNSATSITASITIDTAASLGVRTVTVLNTDGQSGSKINGFTVLVVGGPATGGIDPRTKTADTNLIAGLTAHILTDLTGAPRPRGGIWDIGAYTYAPLPPPAAPGLATDCTLYAAANGSDANSGLTPSLPKTLQGASLASVPGSVICLKGGAYSRTTTFYPVHNGTAGAWITYKAYGDSDPVLTWTAVTPPSDVTMIHMFTSTQFVNDKEYIAFERLTLDGANKAASGFFCQRSHHLRFSHNTIRNMGATGIGSKYCDYLTSDGNLISHVGYLQGTGSGISYNSHQAFDSYTGYHSLVLNNIISGSYDTTAHQDGNGIIMDLSNNSADPATANTPPVLIANNVVYENGGRCIEQLVVTNIWVVNNTCYKSTLDTTIGFGELVVSSAKNGFFINNIAYSWNSRNAFQQFGSNPGIAYFTNIYFAGGLNFTPSDPSQFLNRDPVFLTPPVLDPTAGGQYATALPPWLLGIGLELTPQ